MVDLKQMIDYLIVGKLCQSKSTRNIGRIKQTLIMPTDEFQVGIFWNQGSVGRYWNNMSDIVLINETDPQYI